VTGLRTTLPEEVLVASWPGVAARWVAARVILAAVVVLTSAGLVACTAGDGSGTRGRAAPSGPARTALPPGAARPPGSTLPPTGRPRPLGRTGPAGLPVVIDHGRRDLPLAAITFDSNMTDGMLHRLDTGAVGSYDDTAVVDELTRLRVPATFFLAGKWMVRYPAQTRRLAANPLFELASHSWSHDAFATPCYGLPPLPLAAMAADVRHSFAVLRRFTGHPVPYFRFPGGCYNAAALRAIAPTGVSVVQYDVASGDAFGTSVYAIVAHTLALAGDGSIIVMHLTLANAPLTPLALPRIVAGLRARGITLVKLSDLLAGRAAGAAGPAG
jgi:peptidoglycan/xylan/chitin deacetylase (PgdA/CDA1 family)